MRLAASGPWHWKQFSDSSGRICRWKLILAGLAAGAAIATPPLNTRKIQARIVTLKLSLDREEEKWAMH